MQRYSVLNCWESRCDPDWFSNIFCYV